jgi:hypothetical protein
MNQIICKSLSVFFLILSNYALAQIKGVCIDENGKVIPYVNISIIGKKIGTVSNQKGEFTLDSKKIFNTDRLLFSHLNFKSLEALVPKITKKITLLEKNELLEEVVLLKRKKKVKRQEIGTIKKRKMVTLYSFSKGLGNEIGKLIKVKKNREYELLECKIQVAKLDFENVTIRINFYKVGLNNQIDKLPYNSNNIIAKVDKEGNISIPLKEYYLFIDFNFLVSIEWIDFELKENKKENKKEKNLIEYASNLYNGPLFYRQNKNVKWEEQKLKYNIGLGISLVTNIYIK